MSIEGVDFSTTAGPSSPSVFALRDWGKQFVGRYAVSDRSPNGRGITPEEYARYRDGGIDVFLYWEGTAQWMLGGYAAGVVAAVNAQQNILACGMPLTMPIYFAHDIDPDPAHWAVIDDCLNGCASVVGWERVGVYGGWLLIDYMAGGGTVKWLCQTSAWEYGRGVHPAATLYQYAYNTWIDGTNCDLVRALKDNYGQASRFVEGAVEVPAPPPVKKETLLPLPDGMTWEMVQRQYGTWRSEWGETFTFDKGEAASQVWFNTAVRSIPAGKSWDDGNWPTLEKVIRRGNGDYAYKWRDGSQYISRRGKKEDK